MKPYRQHEFVAGWDYQIKPGWDFEARYDRRRLDHVIEDASLSDPVLGELYTIVNPGEGVNATIDGYANYLTSLGAGLRHPGNWRSTALPRSAPAPVARRNPKAVRNYDGLELRLTMNPRRGLSGMFSYTYSSLWGNYTGLTTTDQSDGGITGRNSPDTTRSFDEPFYYFGANGKSNNGALPTDRPNVLKGYVYYTLPSWKHQTTNIGLFQYGVPGHPDGLIYRSGAGQQQARIEATYIFGRDKWVDMTTDATGNITLGTASHETHSVVQPDGPERIASDQGRRSPDDHVRSHSPERPEPACRHRLQHGHELLGLRNASVSGSRQQRGAGQLWRRRRALPDPRRRL